MVVLRAYGLSQGVVVASALCIVPCCEGFNVEKRFTSKGLGGKFGGSVRRFPAVPRHNHP